MRRPWISGTKTVALFLALFLSILLLPMDLALSAPELETQSQSTANLQQALKDKGFYRGPVDGNYGAMTQQAVMAFRKEIGASRSFTWSRKTIS